MVERYPPGKGSAQLCLERGFFERLKGCQRVGGRCQLGGFGQFQDALDRIPFAFQKDKDLLSLPRKMRDVSV